MSTASSPRQNRQGLAFAGRRSVRLRIMCLTYGYLDGYIRRSVLVHPWSARESEDPMSAIGKYLPGLFLFALVCSAPGRAQQATVTHNAILRCDPLAKSPVVEDLPAGARLTLVDAGPDSGYYHVRTEDDQVGWAFSKYVNINTEAPPNQPPSTANNPPTDTTCDAGLNAHVYHPQRLIVRQGCIAVGGIIVDATNGGQKDGVRHEKDGDSHGWLKVDPEFQSLLNSGNANYEGGNLVFEIICRYPVTQTDARAACQGYADHVTLPPVNSHVRIVGRFGQDTFHGQWDEIHPVTSITVIPN